MKRIRWTAGTLAALFLMCGTSAAADREVHGAFGSGAAQTLQVWQQACGWDRELYYASEWQTVLSDGTAVTCRRAAGYQKEFLEDNLETTRKYLEKSDADAGLSAADPAEKLVAAAVGELGRADAREDPPGSGRIKYSIWFYRRDDPPAGPWSGAFLAWCAERAGLLERKVFLRTADCSAQHDYLVRDRGGREYALRDTVPFGGSGYRPKAGDLLFWSESGGTYDRAGILVSVSGSGIRLICGDRDGGTAVLEVNPDTVSDALHSAVVVNPKYPAGSLAERGTRSETIYGFLTQVMGMSAAAAAGALGNMYVESGWEPDRMEYGYTWNGGAGYGLIQWTNTRRGRVPGDSPDLPGCTAEHLQLNDGYRRTHLVKWCRAGGYDYRSLEGQLFFLQYEFDHYRPFAQALQQMNAVPDSIAGAEQAAAIWQKRVEGSSPSKFTKSPLRCSKAVEVYQAFSRPQLYE